MSVEMLMFCPVKEDVQAVLFPFHERIAGVVEGAWDEWRSVSSFRADQHFDPLLYSRTIANYVFDAIARLAIVEFRDDPSVNIEADAQTVKFVFKGGVVARFKKGDENKLGRNIATQANLAFIDAEGLLPGLPPETAKVEFIWLANELQTNLDQVLVVARNGRHLLWDYEIKGRGDEKVLAFPVNPTDPNALESEVLVRPKTKPSKKTEHE